MFKISDYIVKKIGKAENKELIPYGVRMVGAPLEWNETMGETIKVGIIDTGIDVNHIDLKDRIAKYVTFVPNEDFNDYNGHGTHVAGTIAATVNNFGVIGVAPKCELYVAKTFKKDGTADEESIIEALRFMVESQVQVINMSFSSTETTVEYENAIKEAYASGITLVAAAGNSGELGLGYPALFNETISVAAVDMTKTVTDFSSVGSRVDVCAAGKDIYSTYPGNKYAILSGTSMATPVITGAVALLQGKSKIRFNRFSSPIEIKFLIDMYAEDLGNFGKDDYYGYGLFSFGRIGSSDYVTNRVQKRNGR